MDQWTIDTIGKFAPAAVALAVFQLTRIQNRWLNQVALRNAQMEDQKLRLSLIERRIKAIDAIRSAEEQYHITGDARTIVGPVYEAMTTGQLVFDDEVERDCEDLLKALQKWNANESARQRWRDHDEVRLQAAVDGQVEADEEIIRRLRPLRERMIEFARVRSVAPLAAPGSATPVVKRRGFKGALVMAWQRIRNQKDALPEA